MKAMQQLVKLPELQKTMQEMSKEMMKAGILEEMLEDTLAMDDDVELDDDVAVEVDKVIAELTLDAKADKTKKAVAEASIDLPEPGADTVRVEEEEPEVEVEEDVAEMQSRLEALRS